MKTRKKWMIVLLIIAVLVLSACGTTDSATPDLGTGSSEGVVEKEVTALLEQMDNNLYRYTVNNQTDESLTFEFTSGQRYDVTLSNEKGDEVYRLSAVSSYMQALGEETLEPGEKLEYEIDLPPLELESGSYQMKAWLTPKEGPQYEAETEFTVE